MNVDDTPDEGTVDAVADSEATFSHDVDALAGILDDPEEPDTDEDEGTAADDADEVDLEDDPDTDNSEDGEDEEDTEDDEAEDSNDDDPEDDEDGPEEIKAGRIAPRTAKFKMPDGSLITVDELSKGYLRQSDYTRKRQEDADTSKKLNEQMTRVSETEQHLKSRLDTATAMLDSWKPQPPEVPYREDPMAWGEYQQQLASWEHWEKQIADQRNELDQQAEADRHKKLKETFDTEMAALVEKIPAMSDDSKAKAFFDAAKKTMLPYGIKPEEVDAISDHRFLVVIKDLMQAQRRLQKAQTVSKEVREKPKMVKQSKRTNRRERAGKDNRLGRLRETGSRADGVASLMDLDL